MPAQAGKYRILSASLPPWTMSEHSGIFIEIVTEVERRIGNDTPVQLYPWSRAQDIATHDEESIIFPMARMPAREDKYIWIAKIFPARFAFCSDLYPNLDLDSARQHTIAVHSDAPPAIFLKQHGFEKLHSMPSGVGTIPKMLEARRVDAWFSEVSLIAYGLRNTPLQDKVKCGPTIYETWQYIAGSKSLSQETVTAYREAIENMQSKGVIETIMSRYLPREALKPLTPDETD